MKLTKTFKAFFANEKSGGLLLLFVTIVSLYLANSSYAAEYISFWEKMISMVTLSHIGLMMV